MNLANAFRAVCVLICALVPALIIGGTPAHAATYCSITGGGSLTNGGTSTVSMKIVVASVPRAEIPGRPTMRPWCYQDRVSLGGTSSNRIVEKPRLGSVNASGYRIAYRGDRIGHDRFVIERRWLNGLNNQWNKGTLVFEIDVVAQPF